VHLVGNSLNGAWPTDLVAIASRPELEQIDLAVAYATKMDAIFDLAESRQVPLNLYALINGDGFPSLDVASRFVEAKRASWRLFLTRGFFHPKLMWFRGVGAYVGSANLTDRAWFSNHECGIWLSQEDLERLGWTDEISRIFSVIRGDCREATAEHVELLRRLSKLRGSLNEEQAKHRRTVERMLADLPGGQSPIDLTRRSLRGGGARKSFLDDWNQGLTILRKISALFERNRDKWPDWVLRDVPPAIVQDQATAWWWLARFRASRESGNEMVRAHEEHRADPDRAVVALMESWCRLDETERWLFYVNQSPRELSELLQPDSIAALDEERLARLLFLCHAAREHGRQIEGLSAGTHTLEGRARLYSKFLLSQRSGRGRKIDEVLTFVLWGEGQPLDRIWEAANSDEWKLPHLGVHIFGELLGYARPGEFPPRNNRVSKTLYALGFDGVNYT
jgi:hypothetical protein